VCIPTTPGAQRLWHNAKMNYQGIDEKTGHTPPPRRTLLLVNLGTPSAPTTAAVRKYLAEFLSDPRVIEAPRWLWWLILHGVILRIRPSRSARAYRQIWTDQGSPLLLHSQALCAAVAERLPDWRVELAMSYGAPNLRDVLDRLRQQGTRELAVLPLYPQYSGSTTASVFDAVARLLSRWRLVPRLTFIPQYHDHSGYLDALANSVRAHWQAHGRGDKLVLSFHGVPRRYLRNGDPYFCQCHATARRLRERLQLSESEVVTTFQSRVGREVWLQPYTDKTLLELARAGVKTLDVICPGFAVDCLETLEEIAEQNAHAFIAAGGQALRYIRALNASAAHADALADVVRNSSGMPLARSDADAAALAAKLRAAQPWIDA